MSGSRGRCLPLLVAMLVASVALAVPAGAAAAGPLQPAAVGGPRAKPEARVSRPAAVLLSLVLPGLGQSASGHHGRARFFYGTEAAIWTTSISYRAVANMRLDDVREFARLRAGANPADDSDHYFQLLSDYSSNDIYNIAIRDEARAIYPDDRESQLRYAAENSIQGEQGWHWPDYASRREFQLVRHDALSARRTSLLVTGWAVVNRVISAIEAARSYPRDDEASSEAAPGANTFALEAGMTSHRGEPAAGVGISRTF